MVTLENEQLRVVVSAKGAQLCSVVDKLTATEYIWQGDPDVWAYHAPNLFPIVGNLQDNLLHVNGKSFMLNRHGFARTSQFRRIESSPSHAQFSLDYSEETLKVYPYRFEFQVVFHLEGRTVRVMYKVINKDEGKIYFSLGGHPAFKVPLEDGMAYEDYFFEFEQEERLDTQLLTPQGLISGQTKTVVEGSRLHLTKDMFNNDAYVFTELKSTKVTLASTSGSRKVEVNFPHFNSLGLWAKPGAPFVCIEPWLGYADLEGFQGDVSEKKGIQSVEHGHVFETEFDITV